ncbi:hypothetical protein KIN20_005325 [Parelaphostrongylus tenuis]|uniref:Uncharacterized protein n=1 Tax=Parelaphostrongylus tenuis TaxID=148309 RepID=A0AAD5QIH6_PARTN|nr:hypothetical protein KIN20_005325 [Parelaphostrongylus tenuis]
MIRFVAIARVLVEAAFDECGDIHDLKTPQSPESSLAFQEGSAEVEDPQVVIYQRGVHYRLKSSPVN